MARTRRSELEMSVDYDLSFWGLNVRNQYVADGYSEDSPLLTLLCGHSDLNPLAPKFGINIRDIPARAWQINAIIMRLHVKLRGALIGRYCLPVVYETGEPVAPRVIADALKIHVRAYYRLLKAAREQYFAMAAGAMA